MKLTTISTPTSVVSIAWVSVLLLQLILILQVPVHTNGNVLSNKVVPICEEGCHCFGSGGNCPSYPTITESMLPTYRALNHSNPMSIQCDPFLSSSCVSNLERGEACVVDLIAPNTTAESTCPSGYSYRLRTVPSLENAIANGQFITHAGACGTCSSLQDLALMIEYPNIPYKAQQCFFRSTALKYIEKAVECYQEIGFTESCSTALSYHQKRIVEKECGYQCAAWGYDGDLGRPSCQDISGCGACVDELGITARLELVAGRTFANSGYPSQKGRNCSEITPRDVIGGSDICGEAPFAQSPTEVPVDSEAPSDAPVATTVSPTTEPSQVPTMAPVPLATAAPTGTPTPPPSEPAATARPVVVITNFPSPPPVPLPTPSLSYQQCLSTAAIEVRVGALSEGNGIVCECSEAEAGNTNRPRCFTSPDRNDESQCAILYDTCVTDQECCGNSVRKCRGGLCRPSGRTADRNSLRLSGSLGGAARRDRSSSASSRVIGASDRRYPGVRRRA